MSQTLEQTREAARAEIDRLDRLIKIKEFIIDQLTTEDGDVIDTHLDFEHSGMRISIKKAKTRNQKPKIEAPKSKRGKIKSEPKTLSGPMIEELSKLSFKGLKKKDAIAYLQGEVSKFSNAYWDSFKENFKNTLQSSGKGAGTSWKFN